MDVASEGCLRCAAVSMATRVVLLVLLLGGGDEGCCDSLDDEGSTGELSGVGT